MVLSNPDLFHVMLSNPEWLELRWSNSVRWWLMVVSKSEECWLSCMVLNSAALSYMVLGNVRLSDVVSCCHTWSWVVPCYPV